jgi:hypothetical protein
LGQQCTATAKGTGRRCERRVIAGNVCYIHGGRAKQVRQKTEQKLALYDAQVAAGQDPVAIEQQPPEQLILNALHDVDQVLRVLKNQMRDNIVDPILLEVCGQWLDRLGRLTKVALDGEVAERLEKRLGWLAADRAATVLGHLAAIVEASPLTAAQKLALWESKFDGLRLIADERAPFRLSGDALRRFSDSLLEAAAVERAVAAGVTWGDDGSESEDSEFEAEPDAGGELVLFPSVAGDGERL